jgi:hypothetical protein
MAQERMLATGSFTWYQSTESRVRRIYSLLLKRKTPPGNDFCYEIKESEEFIDLCKKSGTFYCRFDKKRNVVAVNAVDWALVGDIVELYSEAQGKKFLDNYILYSQVVDKASQIAEEMGVVPKPNASRCNIAGVIIPLLFNPSALPPGNELRFLIPGED